MKAENEIFMEALIKNHGPFYAHATQMVSICHATATVLGNRADENEDAEQIAHAFGMLATEAYKQYRAMCDRMGDVAIGPERMVEDAEKFSDIAWKMQAQFDTLEQLQPTGKAN